MQQGSYPLASGGRSRIHAYNENVEHTTERSNELIDKGKFYKLAKYKATFGDPKVTGAKVITVKRNGKVMKGVFARSNEDGVYDMESRDREVVSHKRVKNDGNEVLDELEMGEAVADAAEALPDTSGALTLAETSERAVVASVAAAAAPLMPAQTDLSETEPDGSDSESADSSNASDSNGGARVAAAAAQAFGTFEKRVTKQTIVQILVS